MIKNRLAAGLGLLLIILGAAAVGDDRLTLDRVQQLLEDKRYAEAYQVVTQLYAANTDPEMADALLFHKGKAAYYVGYLTESQEDFQRLIDSYPASPFIPYSHFFRGNIQYREKLDRPALLSYLSAYRLSGDNRLNEILLKSIETAVSLGGSRLLEAINYAAYQEEKKCPLIFAVARGLLAQKNYQPLRGLLSECPGEEASRLLSQTEILLKQQIEIGIALPLSGELQRFGESVLDGAVLMLEGFQRESGLRIAPLIFDTKGRSVEAGRVMKRFNAGGVAAAIGPLTSEETAVASAVLACGDLPLIAPAASQGGLTELAGTCFQLQPSLDRQGIRMAEFARGKLGVDTAAIISPTSSENLAMAEAFADRFRELGGTILGIEYFRTRESDFGPIIVDIKSLAIGRISDSLTYINERGDTIKAKEVPVAIDAIYIPASPEQLTQLLPQIDFYNLDAIYLGSEGWGDKQVYDLGREVLKTSYFTSSRVNGGVTPAARQFAKNFRDKYGREPGHLEAVGYDAMGLICGALQSSRYSRSEIAEYLKNINDYRGIAGVVSFGEKRDNIFMPIYTIESGDARRVEF